MAALAATTLAAWAPPALASGPDGDAVDAVEIAAEAAEVADGPDPQSAPVTFDAEVMPDPTDGISVDSRVLDFDITLADAASLEDAEAVSGQAVFLGEGGVPDYVVDSSDDRLRIMSVINQPDQDHSQEYHLDLPVGSWLEVNEHGGVSVSMTDEASGVSVSIPAFDPPWAVDADGNPVATRYEVAGHTLRQVTTPTSDTIYPITADPQTCSRWCYPFKIWFNQAETKTAAEPANAAFVVGGCTALGGLLGGPAGAVALAAACSAQMGAISFTAQTGRNSRPFRCLRIDFYWPSSIAYPRTYRGSRCR